MGDEDIEILAFAEKNYDNQQWDLSIRFEGNCKIGCEGRKLRRTKNLVTALNWVEYHREGFEHIRAMLMKPLPMPAMFSEPPGKEHLDDTRP